MHYSVRPRHRMARIIASVPGRVRLNTTSSTGQEGKMTMLLILTASVNNLRRSLSLFAHLKNQISSFD